MILTCLSLATISLKWLIQTPINNQTEVQHADICIQPHAMALVNGVPGCCKKNYVRFQIRRVEIGVTNN